MMGTTAAIAVEEHPLPAARPERTAMLVVADEPLCGALLDLAHRRGMDAFACETPLDVIDTLVEVGDLVACAIVSSRVEWGNGLAEFIADEYPHVERIVVES